MSIKYIKKGNQVMTIIKRHLGTTIRLNIFIEQY
jgi:hypothetical protein